MRRLKKSETKLNPKVSEDGMMIVSVEDTRALHTFDHTNVAWKVADAYLKTNPFKGIIKGSLARVIPPHDATDSKVDHIRQKLYEAGAAKVKLLPKAPAPLVVGGDDDSNQLAEAADVLAFRSPRKVIDVMIQNAFTERKGDLAELVNRYLGEAESRKPAGKEFTAVDVGHITGVRLRNWMCFYGEHELELEPKVYSITAQDEDDPERSNWLGKSSLLAAIVFVMSGKYPTKTADGWINGAEKSGGVDLQFSSGLFIGRWKDRGKSTQLEVALDEESDPMTGATAQLFIDEAIVDYETLERTAYLKQKSTDRFVTMGPTERSETVNGWLGTGWIEDAGQKCRDELSSLTAKDASYRTKISDIEKRYEGPIEELIQENRLESARLKQDVMGAKDAVTEAESLKASVTAWNRASRSHDRYVALCDQLSEHDQTEPQGSAGGDVEEIEKEKEKASRAEIVARNEYTTARDVAQGEFNGDCPVAGIQCPAVDRINKQGQVSRTRCENSKSTWDSKKKKLKVVGDQLDERKKSDREMAEWESKRSLLEAEIARLKPDYDYIRSSKEEPPEPDDDVLESYQQAVAEHSQVVASIKHLLEDRESIDKLNKNLEELQPAIELQRSALIILGRSGAQREVAKGALSQIERVGNQGILESGIGLSFKVQWAQETKKLAEACDHCGSPFPSSRRVKQCGRCGIDRGRKLSHELRIVMSNSSGGADDLAGAMFQLSAANWLRQYEGSTWSIFLIDEPFGHLDVANVKGLSKHLGTLLGDQFGASQSFIVAHHADVLESAPGRIHITSTNGKSRIEVYD